MFASSLRQSTNPNWEFDIHINLPRRRCTLHWTSKNKRVRIPRFIFLQLKRSELFWSSLEYETCNGVNGADSRYEEAEELCFFAKNPAQKANNCLPHMPADKKAMRILFRRPIDVRCMHLSPKEKAPTSVQEERKSYRKEYEKAD